MNRSFSDDKAGDRQGGWTDFGASADFRSIPTGVTRLQGGVPFRILDPAKNNGRLMSLNTLSGMSCVTGQIS